MAADVVPGPVPGHRALRLAGDGTPIVEAFRCGSCGSVVIDRTPCCRACGSRVPPEPARMGVSGRLWSWSVVHRSYPTVRVPFVSAIVDLDGGLALKGTLRCSLDTALRQGQAVRLVFDDAGGARSDAGAPYVGFHFELAGAGQ